MKKTDTAREVVARALLGVPIGKQLPTTKDLSVEARAGNGTIQAALKSLEDAGLVVTTAHGRQGRRVVSSDILSLWGASGRGPLTGVMPLPESREFAGIATALSVAASRANLPLQLLFRQGGNTRSEYLDSELVDFSVSSEGAARESHGARNTLPLGPYTYYAKDSVVVITAKGHKPHPTDRVAIDRNSADHTMLTTAEFPHAGLVDVPYLFIAEAVATGGVDAAIWHRTTSSPLMTAVGLSIHELSNPDARSDGYSEGAIVWRSNDAGVKSLLRELIDLEELKAIQKEVMDGLRVPQF